MKGRRALDTVDNSAVTALGEVRSLLDVLRDNPGTALSDVDTLARRLSLYTHEHGLADPHGR